MRLCQQWQLEKYVGQDIKTELNCNLQADAPAGTAKVAFLVWEGKPRKNCPAFVLMMGFLDYRVCIDYRICQINYNSLKRSIKASKL